MTRGRSVYVVDDEESIRRSLRLMLAVQGYAVTPFDSGAALLDALDGLSPGCLLLDLRMPAMDGVEVQRHLAARAAPLPTVVMTGHGDLTVAVAALHQGAVAFLEKPFTKAALAEALAVAFLRLEDPDGFGEHLRRTVQAVGDLGQQERAVLSRLAVGRSQEAIAAELAIDPATVELRRARILTALGVETVNEALRIAFAAGYGDGMAESTARPDLPLPPARG